MKKIQGDIFQPEKQQTIINKRALINRLVLKKLLKREYYYKNKKYLGKSQKV